MSTPAINPIVLSRLVMKNTNINRFDLYGGKKKRPRPFARQILLYIFIKHAKYTPIGAMQCLITDNRSAARDAMISVDKGMLDKQARLYMPRCTGAKDYARIMYERALNTPIPKHRRAVAS